MSNMAEMFSVGLQVKRLKEIEEHPEEAEEKNIQTDGFDITFDHVKFSYEKDKSVLQDVSFTARKGQVTALVRPSGGGKSTVAKLAAKFYPLDSGKILLGGKDIAPLDSAMLMKNFSIVFQDVVLADGTVAESGTHSELMEQKGLYRKLLLFCELRWAWESGVFRFDPPSVDLNPPGMSNLNPLKAKSKC